MKLRIELPNQLTLSTSIKTSEIRVYNEATGVRLDNMLDLNYNITMGEGGIGSITFINRENGVQWVEPVEHITYTYGIRREVEKEEWSFFD